MVFNPTSTEDPGLQEVHAKKRRLMEILGRLDST